MKLEVEDVSIINTDRVSNMAAHRWAKVINAEIYFYLVDNGLLLRLGWSGGLDKWIIYPVNKANFADNIVVYVKNVNIKFEL